MPGTVRYQWEPQTGRLKPDRALGRPEYPTEIVVLLTTQEGSRAALMKAAELARDLRGRIRLLAPRVVPYPLPVSKGGSEEAMLRRQCVRLAAECGVNVHVDILLCRDNRETAAAAVAPEALVVVGGRGRWWPTRERRMANWLRRQGRQVLFTECE